MTALPYLSPVQISDHPVYGTCNGVYVGTTRIGKEPVTTVRLESGRVLQVRDMYVIPLVGESSAARRYREEWATKTGRLPSEVYVPKDIR